MTAAAIAAAAAAAVARGMAGVLNRTCTAPSATGPIVVPDTAAEIITPG